MSVSTEPRKRRAWLAALLSLLLPGLGQLYNRQARLALALITLAALLSMPVRWAIAAASAGSVVPIATIALVIGLVFPLFAIIQAFIGARRAGAIPLAGFNRWYVYAGLYVLVAVLSLAAEQLPIPSITSYSMPSGSMIPTLLVGDYSVARTKAFEDRLPERGELAVFRPPSEPEFDFVKRIVGLPGDRIQLRGGRLYLNGVLVDRIPINESEAAGLLEGFEQARIYRETLPGGVNYLIAEFGEDRGLDNTSEFVVPVGHVFVLGDNRDVSNDSRSGLGFIPLSRLHDKPLFIFWAHDKSRIGKMVE